MLKLLEDESGDGQEDALGLEGTAAPGPAPAPEAGAGEQADALERAEEGAGPAPAGDRGPGKALRGGALPSPPRRGDGPAGGAPFGRGTPWAAQGRGDPPETPGSRTVEAGTAPAVRAEAGLETLYRRTAQAGRPAPQAPAGTQAGRAARAEEPGRIASLTVDELDRAVRRDSRRYDGGMSIF